MSLSRPGAKLRHTEGSRPLFSSAAVAGTAILLAGVAVGCSSSNKAKAGSTGSVASSATTQPAKAKSPYSIGYIGMLSGSLSGLGLPFEAGMRASVAYDNSQGGANGHQINLVVMDDRYDPSTDIADYRQMAGQGVLGVFGLIGSNDGTALQPLTSSVGVPIIGVGVIPPLNSLSFASGLNATETLADEAPLVASLAKQANISKPKIALLATDSVSGRKSTSVFTADSANDGFDIVGTMYLPPAITQFGTQAAQVASWHPDFVLATASAAGMAVIDPALRQAGVKAPIVNYWVGASEQLLSQVKDPQLYVYRDFADPKESAAANMRKTAQSLGMPDGTTFGSGNYYTEGYVMGLLAKSVLEACGDSCTPKSFSQALETKASNIDTQGLTGPDVGFNSTNHIFLHQVRYWHWSQSANAGVPAEALPVASTPSS